MRRALRVVLVIAALLGLFGQTVAVSASPALAAIESTASPVMSADCLGMMQGRSDDSVPCDRMTLACIVGMGCAMPYTFDVGEPVVAEAIVAIDVPAWPSTPSMKGRSVPTEPHPPNTLA